MENEVLLNSEDVEVVSSEMVKRDGGSELVLNYNFNRVNFNDAPTILSYGDEAKDAITKILESSSRLADDCDEMMVDDKLLNSIVSFDDVLDESDRLKEKKDLPVVRGIKSFLTGIGVKKFEEEERKKSYKGQYEEYISRIEEVCNAVESQKQASLNDIELRNSITKEITPYIEMLEEMIKVGQLDKEKYDKETEEMKAIEPMTQDLIDSIKKRIGLSTVFNEKLNELKKALVLYKSQRTAYEEQQTNDMQLVISHESYLKDTAPILKAQGSVKVFNHRQEKRIENMKAINEAGNEAAIRNAQGLEENARAIADLSLNNGISVSSIEKLTTALENGIRIYQDAREQKMVKIERENQDLLELSEALDRNRAELLHIVDENEGMQDVLKQSRGKVKTIGSRHGTKRS